MTHLDGAIPSDNENTNNLRAIFEILAYLHVDARKDGHEELADRLDFAMSFAEQKLSKLKSAQTVPPVSIQEN